MKSDVFIVRVYNKVYMKAINALLSTPAEMMRGVVEVNAVVREMAKIKWGDYQKALFKNRGWPSTGGEPYWIQASEDARTSLAKQKNFTALSIVDAVVPPTKADLLDAAIQKCFNTTLPNNATPGIPIYTLVRQREPGDPNAADHDVHITWIYDDAITYATKLLYTMVCPFEASMKVDDGK